MDKRIGNYAFIIGVVLALVLGLIPAAVLGSAYGMLASLLVVLGIIVGFINVTGKETKEFLLVAAVLIITAGIGAGAGLSAAGLFGGVQFIGQYLAGVFGQLLAFIIPVTVVVALKDIIELSKNA